jgi:shikimate dehydrogenase
MISGKTKIIGIIGDPVSHTASPAMHNAASASLGLDFVYIPFHVKPDQLQKAIEGLRALSITGVNVTIPHKEAVIPLLDRLDSSAQRTRAVNTIVNEAGVLVGYNTDGAGFCYALEHEANFNCHGKKIVIIGAGGSAKAIASALAGQPIKSLSIINRHSERARQLAMLLSFSNATVESIEYENPQSWIKACHEADLVINTTPVGMAPDSHALPLPDISWLQSNQLICDIIYSPPTTEFLKRAKIVGASILNGAGMLAGQGVLAYEKFTGALVPYAVMRREIAGA